MAMTACISWILLPLGTFIGLIPVLLMVGFDQVMECGGVIEFDWD